MNVASMKVGIQESLTGTRTAQDDAFIGLANDWIVHPPRTMAAELRTHTGCTVRRNMPRWGS